MARIRLVRTTRSIQEPFEDCGSQRVGDGPLLGVSGQPEPVDEFVVGETAPD